MIGKSAIAYGVLLPALALVSGSAVDSKIDDGQTVSASVVEMFDIGSSPEEMNCSFANPGSPAGVRQEHGQAVHGIWELLEGAKVAVQSADRAR